MRETRSRPKNRSWPWIGAAAGAATGLGDGVLMLWLGAEMTLGRTDVTLAVIAFFAITYVGLGYLIGRLLQARTRARADADVIERQLRDLERTQRALVQQEKLAAIGRVAAGVAHEVRNPLGVIRASAAMVQESFEREEDPYRACRFICEEIDRLNSLITALLTFSRPAELRRERVNLEKVIDRAAALAHDMLRGRGIALEREFAGEPAELSADPNLVAQVVYGLISNAAEALDGAGRIAVRLIHEVGFACIEVADGGPGVPPDAAPQIFEPFFTTKATGTGLGLPMAERIAHAHGGSLRCLPGHGAGEGGRGACFRLELPLETGGVTAGASA
jgi:two-component system sensor histidine kinase HydH